MRSGSMSFRTEEGIAESVGQLSDKTGLNKSDIINKALAHYIKIGGPDQEFDDRVRASMSRTFGFGDLGEMEKLIQNKLNNELAAYDLNVRKQIDLMEDRIAEKIMTKISAQPSLAIAPANPVIEVKSAVAVVEDGSKPKSTKVIMKTALQILKLNMDQGYDTVLGELAISVGMDKKVLSKALADLGIKSERKRRGGEKETLFTPDKIREVEEALKTFGGQDDTDTTGDQGQS